MSSLFDVFVAIGADTSGLEEGIEKSKGLLGGLGGAVSGGMKVAGASIAAVGAAVAGVSTAMVQGTGEVAAYGDNIDKMSQKMGISAQAYQEWDAIMQHSGTTIEALKPSMKTLASAAEKGSDAFTKLGISEEEVASLSQEDLFSKVITGLQGMEEGTERTYITSQLLGRGATELGALLNTSAEDTEAMRQRVHELGGVMSDEAVKAAAAYQDQLQDMQTAFDGLKRNLLSDFMPALTGVMGGLTEIFSGDFDSGIEQISTGVKELVANVTSALPEAIKGGAQIVEAIGQAILENIPTILPAMTQVVLDIGQMIIENLPMLMDTGMQIITSIGQMLIENIPILVPQIAELVTQMAQMLGDNADAIVAGAIQILTVLATSLLENAPTILEAIMQLTIAVAEAILNNLPLLLESLLKILGALIQAFITWIPQFIQSYGEFNATIILKLLEFGGQLLAKVGEILVNLFKALGEKLTQIATKVADFGKELWNKATEIAQTFVENMMNKMGELPGKVMELGENMLDAIRDLPERFLEIGSNIVQGLWDGISNSTSWIKEKISGWVGDVVSFLKNLFGIASPSKVMRDVIGINLGKGVALGIEKSLPAVEDAMEDMSDLVSPEVSPIVSVGNGGGFSNSSSVLAAMEKEQNPNRNLTVILELEKTQLARAVYALNNEETQRVGLNLAGGYA